MRLRGKKSLKSKYYFRAHLYFRDLNGGHFKLTPGQEKIFEAIYEPNITRATIKATTQYGKSEVAAMALVSVVTERLEKVLIIAPSIKQSSIIMGKFIDHLFDHPLITGMIDYSGGTLERLKQERSKSRVTIKNGSEVKMLTAQAHTVAKEAKNLMGFGATIVLIDESGLIPDTMYSKILRMVGGHKDGKLVQLGNPFEGGGHFAKSFREDRYTKISVNWKQALEEGRLTQEFLDEAKENISDLDWQIFYDCEFPKTGADNAVIPMDWILNAVDQKGCEGEYKQAGLDVARFGRDSTVYIPRNGGKVSRIDVIEQMGTMEVVGWTRGFLEKDELDALAIDVIGIGSGVYDRLEEVQDDCEWGGIDIIPVNVGESPTDDEMKARFFNLRAQIFWHLRKMFKPDKNGHSQISIPNDPGLIKELSEVRYKYSSERKIKIEPKDEMKKRLGKSPDKADALALAFFNVEESTPGMFIVDG